MSTNPATSSSSIPLTASVKKNPKSDPVRPPVTLEQLKSQTERRAKEIFQARTKTGASGDALSDWLQAEKEIKAKLSIKN